MTLTEYLQLYLDNRRTLSGFRILAGKTSEMLGPSGWKAVGENVFTAAMIVKLARRLVNGKELTAGVPMPFNWNQSNWSLTFGADPPALEIKLLDTKLDESPLTTTHNLPEQILDEAVEAGRSKTGKSPRVRTRVARLGLVKRPSKAAEPSVPVAEVAPQVEPVTSEFADRAKPKRERSRKPEATAQPEVAAEPEVAPLDTTVVAPDNQAGPEDDLAPIAPLEQCEFSNDPEVTSDASEVLLEGGAAQNPELKAGPELVTATEETAAEPSEVPSTIDSPSKPASDRPVKAEQDGEQEALQQSVELVSFEVEQAEPSKPEVASHTQEVLVQESEAEPCPEPEVGSQPVAQPDTDDVSADLDGPLDPSEPEPEVGAELITGPNSQESAPTEETAAEPFVELCKAGHGAEREAMEPSVELVFFEVEQDEPSKPEVASHAQEVLVQESEAEPCPEPEVGSQPIAQPDTDDVSADLDGPPDPSEPEPEVGAELMTGPDSQASAPTEELDMGSYLRLVLSGGPEALAHLSESSGAVEAEADPSPEPEVRAEPLTCADAPESDVVTAVEMSLDSFLEVLLSGPSPHFELLTEAEPGPEVHAEPVTGVDAQEPAVVAAQVMALGPSLPVEPEVELELREPQPDSSESSGDAAREAALEVCAEPVPFAHTQDPGQRFQPAEENEPGPTPRQGPAQEPPLARLALSLLKGRLGRKLCFAPGNFPVLFLDNFPISVGSTVTRPEQMDDLIATIPLRLESSTPNFSHWQQNAQALWADSPFLPDCRHRLEGSEDDLQLLAERPGESVVRRKGVLYYLGDAVGPVELCKNEERGPRAPQVLMRDRAIWVLAWVSKPKKRWLPRLGGAHECQLIRYARCDDQWSGSRFATFEKSPIWSVSANGQMCGWMSATKSEWKLEIVDCQEETVLGEFTLTAGQGKPGKLLVSDEGNFVIQVDRMAVVGVKAEQGHEISQFPLEVEMECESIGPFGLLCRHELYFQHCPLQRNPRSCQVLTLAKLKELARTYPLVHVPQAGPALAYLGRWLVLPFDRLEASSWQALLAELRQTHPLQQPFEVVDLDGEKRFLQVLKEHLQLSQFRVLPSDGEWTIIRADHYDLELLAE